MRLASPWRRSLEFIHILVRYGRLQNIWKLWDKKSNGNAPRIAMEEIIGIHSHPSPFDLALATNLPMFRGFILCIGICSHPRPIDRALAKNFISSMFRGFIPKDKMKGLDPDAGDTTSQRKSTGIFGRNKTIFP